MWQSYGLSRQQVLDQLQNAANRIGYGGVLVWAVYAWPVPSNPKQYNFAFGEDGSAAIEKQWAAAASGSISGVQGVSPTPPGSKCSDNVPPGGYTCAQQKGYGKCAESWMTSGGFCAKTCGRCSPAKRADGTEIMDDDAGYVSVQSATSQAASAPSSSSG